jgi:hypothetical protein
MTHRILIELSADPVAMTSKALLDALAGLSASGVRVTGVEALDAELFVVASFLRLRLQAGPLAAQLGLGLHSPAEDGALTREERRAVVDRLEAFKREALDSFDRPPEEP